MTAAAVCALVLSGAVQAWISPPAGWILLHPVAWVPALLVFSQLTGRRALLAGWLVGASANAAIFYWIAGTVSRFSNVPAPLAGVVLALFALASGFYAAVFAWGIGAVRRAFGRRWPLGVAAWFTAVEFANPQLFTYHQGVAWYQVPSLFLVASLAGVSAATFLVMLCNAWVVEGIEVWRGTSDRRTWIANGGLLLALLAGAAVWSAARESAVDAAERAARSLRVALVQPNTGVIRRREMRRMAPETFAQDLVALSREALARSPGIDVFVWPEGALSRDPGDARNRSVLDFVRETGAEVWTGANDYRHDESGRARSYNSAFRIFGNGEIDVRYDKTILVPFGEFMPFADAVPALRRIRGPGDFARGDGMFVYAGGAARFAFLICYEAIRADYVRRGVRQDPELLVNLTFDAWFGDTSEPSQHLMLAAIQAAQYGVPLLRATTTGISAVVDARGLIVARTRAFTRDVLVADVKPLHVPSPYARFGDWFPWGCAAAVAVALAASRRRERAP